jgi:hypothetical protein
VGIRDKMKRLERAAETETLAAVCLECGEEQRVRHGILVELTALEWKMHQDGEHEEPPADTPSDVRWVWEHPHGGLSLVDKYTHEPIFGSKWAEAATVMEEREDGA